MSETVTHNKPQSIWLFDYPSLLSMDDCPELLVLLSERDVNIIYNSVLNIDRFRSRVFNDREGNNYEIVTLDEFSQFQEFVSDMKVNLGAYNMCNELLERIAEALEGMVSMSSGCCGGIEGVSGGSAGSGMEDAPPSDTVDNEGSHSGSPPPGYSTWDEFDQEKCNWAQYIYDQIIADVATMSLVVIGTTGATGLAGILIPLLTNPVGWVLILSIATTMIAATVEAAFYGWISTHLDTYRDDYICSMLDGEDVGDSVSNFASRVDVNLADDANFNSLTGYWASTILKGLGNVGSFNRMYDKQSLDIPDADCPCGGETVDYTVVEGTETSSHPSNPFTVDMQAESSVDCGLDARAITVSFPVDVTITVVTISGSTACGVCTGDIYRYFSDEGATTLISSSTGNPQSTSPVSGVRAIYFLVDCDGDDPAFNVTYTID